MKNFTIKGYADADFLDLQRYEDLSGDVKMKYKDVWAYVVGIDTQTRLTRRLSFNVGVSYTLLPFNDKGVDLSTGEQNVWVLPEYWTYDVSLNYQIIPNRLVARRSW